MSGILYAQKSKVLEVPRAMKPTHLFLTRNLRKQDSAQFTSIPIKERKSKSHFYGVRTDSHLMWEEIGSRLPSQCCHWISRQTSTAVIESGSSSREKKEFLENPELEIRRGEVGHVTLPGIFVCPDLRELTSESNYEKSKTVPGDNAIEYISTKSAGFIVGPDQCGKSAMAKMIALHLKAQGNLPILASATKIPVRAESFKPAVADMVSEHYGACSPEQFFAAPLADKALLIDDYQFLHPDLKRDHAIFEIASRFFGRVIVLCHDTELTPYELGKLSLRVNPRINVFSVPPLTYQRRSVLIDKWLSLSDSHGKNIVEDQRLEVECHRLVNAVVNNYMQPFPPYVLSILQSIESGRDVDLSASTHGHLYEVFIKAALAKRSTLTNYNVISTFLATLAIASFEEEKHTFGDQFIEQCYERFKSETDLTRDLEKMKKDLLNLRLLSRTDGEYRFREKYIYYYFVAFYLKDRIHVTRCRELIVECANKAWNQDYANVLLFLAHLSKDNFIVETILKVARCTFSSIEPPTLQGDLNFLGASYLESVALDDKDESSKETRLNALEEAAGEAILPHTPYALKRDATPQEVGLIGELSAALKTLQVLGQVLKNFPANFDPARKVEIVNECILLGLRTLGKYFDFAERGKVEIIKEFADLVRQKSPGILDASAKEYALATVANLCHLSTFGVVKRTSIAIGSSDLTNTYSKVFTGELSPAKALVKISLELDHAGHFPEESILGLAKDWTGNRFAKRVLRTLVLRHFRLFHLNFSVRQRVGEKLEISYKNTTALPVRDKLIPE